MLKVAAVFSDRMVLQRGKRIAVFGEGESGKTVTALIYKQDDGCEPILDDAFCTAGTGCGKCCAARGNNNSEVNELYELEGVAESERVYGEGENDACELCELDGGAGYVCGNGVKTESCVGCGGCPNEDLDDMELVSEIIVDSAETVVDKSGKWILYLPEQKAGAGYVLEVYSGDEAKLFTDVAVGEVFLAGGQSNMELELQNCTEWPSVQEKMKAENKPNDIRFYYTQKRSYFNEKFYEDEANTAWAKFGDEWTKSWSAVGYFFAEKLSEKLDCPIGIIGCNWGGTSASCWVSREILVENHKTKVYVDEYNASPFIMEDPAEQIRDYEEYLTNQAEWDKKAAEIYKVNPFTPFAEVEEKIGKNLYPGPMNGASFLRPAGLYETMLKRVCPYTLKGFIYYQGETDDCKADSYYVLMSNLIRQWRNDWKEDSIPFIITQLPMHRYNADPDYKHWCVIRDAQMKVFNTVKNTGLAVIIDQGEFSEIHPKRKQIVGERIALQALCEIYGLISEEEANGPMYASHLYKDGGIEISFKYAKDGLVVKNRDYGEEPWKREDELSKESTGAQIAELTKQGIPTGFEVAGEDGSFYPAEAAIVDGNKIFVYSDAVLNPVYVRYLWTNYSEVNLFGVKNGIPVAPFKTL